MANAFVMFGSVDSGIPVVDILDSETVAGGAVSDPAPAGTTFVRVTAMDGPVYTSVGAEGAADASADPRAYVPQATWIDLDCDAGQEVSVENA